MNEFIDQFNGLDQNTIDDIIGKYVELETGDLKELKDILDKITKTKKNIDLLESRINNKAIRRRPKSSYKYNLVMFQEYKEELIKMFINKALNKGYVLEYIENDDHTNKKFLTLSNDYIKEISDVMRDKIVEKSQSGSDATIDVGYIYSGDYKIFPKRINRNNNGGYFNFINMSQEDLSDLQIYNEEQFYSKIKDRKMNCLYFSLLSLFQKLDPENIAKIVRLKNFGLAGNITTSNLKEIANKLDINIILTTHVNKQLRHKSFGNKNHIKFPLALFKSHYFINDNGQYNKVKKMFDQGLFVYKACISEDNQFNNSVVDDILELTNDVISRSKPKNYEKKLKSESCDEGMKEYFKDMEENSKTIYIYADFETCPANKKGEHREMMISYIYDELDKPITLVNTYNTDGQINKSCSVKFIDALFKLQKKYSSVNASCSYEVNIVVYFHNLKFDSNFLFKVIKMRDIVYKDGAIYTFSISKNISFRDSLKLIACPLKKIPTLLGFSSDPLVKDLKKEVVSYSYYNKKTRSEAYAPVNEYIKCLRAEGKTTEEIKQFRNNLVRLELLSVEYITYEDGSKKTIYHFDHMKYMEYYCEQDVLLLQKGMHKLKEYTDVLNNILNLQLDRVVKLDLFDSLTISSLASKLFDVYGAYEGVCEISGEHRDFIQRCVTGGLCSSAYGRKHIISEPMQDFDACSLYPSAIYRLPGFLKGTPKVFGSGTIAKINAYHHASEEDITSGKVENILTNPACGYDGYYLRIKVDTSKVTHWGLPNIFVRNEKDGTIKYIHNDSYGEIEMYVGHIKYNDLIEFQNARQAITVIEGLYYNEGYNDLAPKIIDIIYNERVKLKRSGSKAEVLLKLIMNASYGKLIMKSSDFKYTSVENDKLDDFYMNNYNDIMEYSKFPNFSLIKVKKSIREHYSSPHIGVDILDMSKRIMNEVKSVAYSDECQIEIYYQDTDSMHIKFEEIRKLDEAYRKKYNRPLIGENMGEFHCDFAPCPHPLQTEQDKFDEGTKEYNEIKAIIKSYKCMTYSEKFIVVGKKFYMDKLKTVYYKVDNEEEILKCNEIEDKDEAKKRIDAIKEEEANPNKYYDVHLKNMNNLKESIILYHEHVRAKGVNKDDIKRFIKSGDNKDINNFEDVYNELYCGKKLSFNINRALDIDFINGSVTNAKQMSRDIQFE